MQDGSNNLNINPTLNKENHSNNNVTVVKTDVGAKDGQEKCPKCGGTDIATNTNNGKLRCNFCRYEFEVGKISGMVEDITQLQGQVIGSGAKNIVANANDFVTFKCSSCGAEVVVDTASSAQARCHWCRNTLSVNQQIPNGSIPDVVLPFHISKEEAKIEIEKFVGKRKFFAHPKFKAEFTVENIMGVYFPYMLVDINAHATLSGEGEIQTRMYSKGSGNNRTTYYDADLYHVERDFDLTINGLSIESNADKLNNNSTDKTNNIINSIMPFDVENSVMFNANYLKGYTSEKRDTNIEQLRPIVVEEAKDISRYAANDTLQSYDRGVSWANENLTIKGEQWKSAYLPVWLYSYQQVNGNKKLLHYVAVNARTKEVMGSVPIHIPKLLGISFLVEILGFLAMIFIDFDYDFLFLLAGFVYFMIIFFKYRDSNARHAYETETKKSMTNVRKVDNFIKSKKGLTSSTMDGANNKSITSQDKVRNMLNSINNQNANTNSTNSANMMNNNMNNGGQ